MQVDKKATIERVDANIKSRTEELAKARNAIKPAIAAAAKELTEDVLAGKRGTSRCVPLETVNDDVECRQAFADKLALLAADEQGAVTVSDYEHDNYCAAPSAAVNVQNIRLCAD